MQTSFLPATVPKISLPSCPGAVETRKFGMSLYGTSNGSSMRFEKPPSPAFINGKTGTVLNVYTRPEYRRRRLARRVVDRLIECARAMDLSVIDLKGTDAGYPLYRAAGFTDDVNKYRPMKWRP